MFQKDVHKHVLANYKFPSNIVYLVKELQDPVKKLMKSMPRSGPDACWALPCCDVTPPQAH